MVLQAFAKRAYRRIVGADVDHHHADDWSVLGRFSRPAREGGPQQQNQRLEDEASAAALHWLQLRRSLDFRWVDSPHCFKLRGLRRTWARAVVSARQMSLCRVGSI